MKSLILFLVCLFAMYSPHRRVRQYHRRARRLLLHPGGHRRINPPGDTVLVQPGRHLETIDFKGKDIVLGSLFITSQNTSYVSKTIIDGNRGGTAVTFQNGETSCAELR